MNDTENNEMESHGIAWPRHAGAGYVPGRDPAVDSRLLEFLLENALEGIALVDRRGIVRRVNQTFCRMVGQPPVSLEGRHFRRMLEDGEEVARAEEMTAGLVAYAAWQGDVIKRRPGGGLFKGCLKVNRIAADNGAGTYLAQLAETGCVALLGQGVSSLAADPLTGLPNRMLFEDRLQQAISQARRHGRCVGLMFLDVDRFKLINDSLGHEVGDELLRAVAHRLTQVLRTSDSVARIGADEFGLLLSDINDAAGAVRNASIVARKVYDALKEPLTVGGHEVELSAAMGITLFPQDAPNHVELMKHADTALTHARRKGWNSYQFFSTEMMEKARQRFELETSLRRALERDELKLFYQPQVELTTGEVIGAEALIRWIHPERGMVSPVEFIPVAEESGLIIPIGEWVLRTACRQLATWRGMGVRTVRVGVNISPIQFKRQNLADLVEQVLQETGINPHQLDLEITESAIMEDVEAAAAMLHRISRLGVKLSIDDFGTGYSSLSTLRQFPFQALKIDRSFLRQIQHNRDDAAIVNAIIAMAHSMNQVVVAEGLETVEQLHIMRKMQCNEMQGFLFSKPVPVAEMTEMLIRGVRLE